MYAYDDVEAIKKLILNDVSGIYSGASIKHTYAKAIKGFSAKLTERAVKKVDMGWDQNGIDGVNDDDCYDLKFEIATVISSVI